jgi:hypothetical protein
MINTPRNSRGLPRKQSIKPPTLKTARRRWSRRPVTLCNKPNSRRRPTVANKPASSETNLTAVPADRARSRLRAAEPICFLRTKRGLLAKVASQEQLAAAVLPVTARLEATALATRGSGARSGSTVISFGIEPAKNRRSRNNPVHLAIVVQKTSIGENAP